MYAYVYNDLFYTYIWKPHTKAPSCLKDVHFNIDPPYHPPCWLWCAIAPTRSLTLTEPYLRLVRTQHSFTFECSWWHRDVGKELGFKDVVIWIVRVSETGTAESERIVNQFLSITVDSNIITLDRKITLNY